MTVPQSQTIRASTSVTLLFALFFSLYLFFPQPSAPSPAAQLAISLANRFPNTPTTARDAQLNWLATSPHGEPGAVSLGADEDELASTAWLPALGSPEWAAAYPLPSHIGPRPHRQWIRRLNWLKRRAALSGDTPLSIAFAAPRPRLELDGLVTYPDGTVLDGGAEGVCSWERSGCLRNADSGYVDELDTVDGDNRTWAVNFDDGPLPPSKKLYELLDRFDTKATHFWIGGNVLKYPDLALVASERGDHLAVHAWSHSHLTSLTDYEILGELGWTMQVIHDLTGKVPRYFRPPYGNIDNRVRAIAKHVFGLETVIWNFDSVDWGLNQTYATGDQVDAPDPLTAPSLADVVGNIEGVARAGIEGKPAAGAVVLEHELSDESVEAFARSWESVKKAGWKTGTLPECLSGGKAAWYQ